MPLTDHQCRQPNTTGRLEKRSDGGGLRLVVSPKDDRRRWELVFRWQGKPQTLSLGPYPEATLTAARAAREKARLDLEEGRRPGTPDADAWRPPCKTLRQAAEARLEVAGAQWEPSHRARVEGRLRKNVLPELGGKRLDDITPPDVLAAVRKVEARGAKDVSRRTVQAFGAIYRFSIASEWVTANPPATYAAPSHHGRG